MSTDLKTGPFKTTATLKLKESNPAPVEVQVDNRAATRQAIIVAIRRRGMEFRIRSDWHAKDEPDGTKPDWDYHSVAVHHAGNSSSCATDGNAAMRSAETTDLHKFGQVSYHYAIDCQGVIFEAHDIRSKGAHVEGGNTGVVGIVFLADFSMRGEAGTYGPGVAEKARQTVRKSGVIAGLSAGAAEWMATTKDELDASHDEPTEPQLKAAEVLVGALTDHFHITKLGGHREFAKKLGTGRPCPGVYGLIIVDMLRKRFKLSTP
jgi:hypothetical protein